jgi:ABC-type amino acid transport substrate-binding protein
MNFFKLIKSIFALAIMVGCASFSSDVNAQSVLDKVKRDKKIIVGAREAAPPYGFIDAAGTWKGWSMDLSRAIHGIIEKKLDMKIDLVFKPITPATRIPLIINGTLDWVLGTTGRSVKREDVVDFSVINNGVCVEKLSAKSSGINTTSDLAGKRVGVTKGSNEERYITALGKSGKLNPPATIVAFDKHSTGFLALSQGKTDAHVTLRDTLVSMAKKSPNPDNWQVNGPSLFCNLNGIILPENDSNWKDMVDHSLCYFIVTGGYEKLWDEWFSGANPKAGYEKVQSDTVRALVYNQCSWGAEKFLTAN